MPHIRTDNQPATQITVIEPEPRRIGPSSICCPWSAPVTKKKQIVRYGNVLISGGVTSGIDFAFRIVAELAGPEVAQAIQLAIEYDPSPPSMPATLKKVTNFQWPSGAKTVLVILSNDQLEINGISTSKQTGVPDLGTCYFNTETMNDFAYLTRTSPSKAGIWDPIYDHVSAWSHACGHRCDPSP